jgi:hypothetical protein
VKSLFSRYEPEISKITKANSVLVNNRLFYIIKKDEDGKACKAYCVYDYETRIKLGFFWDKTTIVDNLKKIFKEKNISDKLDMFFDNISKGK